MAERRMFAKTIIDSDAFLDMPLSSQALYFHLSMRADDDGFINNPMKIMRMVNATKNDLDLLIAKRFVLVFESGVIVIKHWKIHNLIQKDRYKSTMYTEEKSQLEVKANKAYKLMSTPTGTPCIQNGYSLEPQVRLGKDRLGKVSIGESITPVSPATETPYEQIRKSFIANCPSLPKPNKTDKWTDGRRKAIRDKKISADEFTEIFKRIERSDFLTARTGNWHGCSIDWILKPANWQKINEGNYDNHSSQKPQSEPDRGFTFDIDEYERQSMNDTKGPV